MNKQSNGYIIVYSTVMVLVVASLLSFIAINLRGMQKENVDLEKKGNLLQSVGLLNVPKGEDKATVIPRDYSKYIVKALLVNRNGDVVSDNNDETFAVFVNITKEMSKPASEQRLPLFVAKLSDGSEKYIFPVNGTGLWGPVWGYIALNGDLNSIYGVVFDHQSETPGLGAEITTPKFTGQFVGKEIFKGSELVGVKTLKGGLAAGNPNAVDAITGGTITSRAVEDMILNSLKGYYKYIINNQVK